MKFAIGNHPDALAVSGNGRQMSYGELDRRSNALAHKLRALGVGRDQPVGLLMRRTPSIVVGALGILKAGGAYLPLDPAFPAERLAFMAQDASARVVITEDACSCRISCGPWALVALDDSEADHAPESDTAEHDLAYVIYTSGSTGQPKGVLIEHRSLDNLIAWHNETFGVSTSDRASHVSSFGFDAAVWELWPYLAAGASVHFVDDESRTEPEALRDWVCAHRITIAFAPTVMAEHMISLDWPSDASLRTLLTGADTLHRYPAGSLPFRLVNNYGPTECTVVATSGTMSAAASSEQLPPIGRGIRNTQIHILDQNLIPVAPGETGELCIGGAGVARGYLNRPDLTAQKFVRDPFSSEPGARMYRSGDLARQLPDGQIVFLGRADNQIKIRGFRIEPEEIAAALSRHPAVASALVTAGNGHGSSESRLTAYVVARGGARPENGALQDSLRAHLPEYMIPSDIVWLGSFPLTPNGKIDRAALPEPVSEGVTLPANGGDDSLQERLAAIVAALLRSQSVGPDDNFFLLGGHSMLGAQMIARIRDAFGVELSLRTLFESPTVATLVAAIDAKRACAAAAGGSR
ncbi:MAG TPA: non-ribosomal peptide synthetase [Bryobacteraceae bacterium]|nr:non-ribosomal peptide synthetase [Bryobacteraceae bacterium]